MEFFNFKMEVAAELGAKLYDFDPIEAQVTFSRTDCGYIQCYIQRLISDREGMAIGVDPLLLNKNQVVGEKRSYAEALDDLIFHLEMELLRKGIRVEIRTH